MPLMFIQLISPKFGFLSGTSRGRMRFPPEAANSLSRNSLSCSCSSPQRTGVAAFMLTPACELNLRSSQHKFTTSTFLAGVNSVTSWNKNLSQTKRMCNASFARFDLTSEYTSASKHKFAKELCNIQAVDNGQLCIA